jgi:hypothetical protein
MSDRDMREGKQIEVLIYHRKDGVVTEVWEPQEVVKVQGDAPVVRWFGKLLVVSPQNWRWPLAIAMLLLGCTPMPVEWCLVPAPDAAPYCYARQVDCEEEAPQADRRVTECYPRAIGSDAQP